MSLDEYFKKRLESGEDKESICLKKLNEIYIHSFLGEYSQATEKLKRLNADFPDLATYDYLNNNPLSDKIKKEYPPFKEALNNLKLKPVMDVSKLVKL